MDVEYGHYYHDLDDIDDIDESDEEEGSLRRIANEYNTIKLYNISDEELEDKLRDILRNSTVVQIRSLCKRLGIRKVSGLKKHELIDEVISWGNWDREGQLRRLHRAELIRIAKDLGVGVEMPFDIDKVIKDIIEFMDTHNIELC